MKYVVAVSGGVDSVVLLHKLINQQKHDIVVAHFDHGIRPSSASDARFVAGLAELYGVAFESRREELGSSASEDQARERRYLFLRGIASKHQAKIVTAHHADDVVESMAINLRRGTGWRGLTVMSRPDIFRPLLAESKTALYDYASSYCLEWVEDETNQTDAYLRNRLRVKLTKLEQLARQELLSLRTAQLKLRREIDTEARGFKLTAPYSRYFFTHIDPAPAVELIRRATSFQLTRPQARRLLHFVKVAQSGTVHQAGQGCSVRFTQTEFIVETP